MKLKTEQQDPVNSNAFLHRELGSNALQRFKEWKACFATQDPKIPISSHKTHPNFKVDEYFRHLQLIFRYAWLPGRDLSGDEQTMGFKGRHREKLRISYKKEGDGIQCDCLAVMDTLLLFIFETNQHQRSTLIWDTHHFMLHVLHCLTVSWTSTPRCVLITFTCLQSFA
jgi:hypothetical protein